MSLHCMARKSLKGEGYLEQCPNKKKEHSLFCGKHQTCKNPFVIIAAPASPATPASPVAAPNESALVVVFENTTDFYNLDPIDQIPPQYLYAYKEHNHYYAFDITTLHEYLTQHSVTDSGDYKNPYTNVPIPPAKVAEIIATYNRTKLTGAPMDHYKECVEMSPQKQLQWRSLSIFQHINKLGHYSDFMWLWQLNLRELREMYDGLCDLWNYRIYLSLEQKQQILPHYTPFSACTLSQYSQIQSLNTARSIMLNEIEKFVTLGLTRDHQYTGSILVLTALVEVSREAATHMPFLVPDVVEDY